MSNYIKIPLNATDRPLTAGALTNLGTGGGTTVNGTIVTPITPTTDGGGTGATCSVTITAGDIIVAIVAVGSGYSAGDTLTIAAGDTGTGGQAQWDADIEVIIDEADLATEESGSYQLVPAENVAAIAPDSSAFGPIIHTSSYSGSAVKKYTLVCNGADANNYGEVAFAVSEAYRKAMMAENSQPTVEFPQGVTCYSVTYG